MLKSLLVSLALFLVPISAAMAELQVSADGCQQIGMVAGGMALNLKEGKAQFDGIMTEDELASLNPELLTHLKLIGLVISKYPNIDPQTHAESYTEFCYSARGDVKAMNDYITEMLKVQET